MPKKSGFTLIELMIVVAIIGILAAIAIPSFYLFLGKSRRTELQTGLGGIYTAETAYFASYSSYQVGSVDCLATPDPLLWDKNLTIGGNFNLASPAKFYGFCVEVYPLVFFGRGAGNIDPDLFLDQGYVTGGDRTPVIVGDDILN